MKAVIISQLQEKSLFIKKARLVMEENKLTTAFIKISYKSGNTATSNADVGRLKKVEVLFVYTCRAALR